MHHRFFRRPDCTELREEIGQLCAELCEDNPYSFNEEQMVEKFQKNQKIITLRRENKKQER
ncbi:hypothetical protein B5F35_04915 [Anaeromassilibacillus sp. An200]|nr:hypothetical protein B5F35_04915 [Anaeromassilibacillus sp. An200]